MSRLEFMKELARLLEDLPKEEKIEILKYYNGYFDDAGEENEASIIEELGSPAKVAASVKAGMDDRLAEHMEFTEKGVDDEKTVHEYEESRSQTAGSETFAGGGPDKEHGGPYEEYSSVDYGQSRDTYDHKTTDYDKDPRFRTPYGRHGDGQNGGKSFAIILLLIMTFPIWIGLLGGLIGLIAGAFGILLALCGAVIGSMAGVLGTGIGCICHGLVRLFTAPLNGMLSLSVGILLSGIGLILLLLCGWVLRVVFGRLFPGLFRAIGSMFSWIGGLFGRRRA